MSITAKIKRFLKIKIATAVFVTASVAAFATLGDGGKKGSLNLGNTTSARTINLKSSHNFRAKNLFRETQPKFITLNTVVTYQKGNATYIVPLKKKVILDKVKFNPAPARF